MSAVAAATFPRIVVLDFEYEIEGRMYYVW